MKRLTLGKLISGSEDRLGICFISSRKGLAKKVAKPVVRRYPPEKELRRNTLLLLSPDDLAQIGCPPFKKTPFCFTYFKDQQIALIFISGNHFPPADVVAYAEANNVPLCISRHDSFLLESRLKGLIREKWDGVKMLHASLVSVDGIGILLTGEAGVGKTVCAVDLVQRGYGWVADDVVIVRKRSSDTITGYAHRGIEGLAHIRGRGILRIADYVNVAPIEEVCIRLVVEINPAGCELRETLPATDVQRFLGVPITRVILNNWNNGESVASQLLKIVHGCR